MGEPTPRLEEILFEVFEPLPRQGPGNRACAAGALGLCVNPIVEAYCGGSIGEEADQLASYEGSIVVNAPVSEVFAYVNAPATHQGIGMLAASWTNIVEPHDGGAKPTMKLEYTIPVPVLGKLAAHLTIQRNARELEASLLNRKETLEA